MWTTVFQRQLPSGWPLLAVAIGLDMEKISLSGADNVADVSPDFYVACMSWNKLIGCLVAIALSCFALNIWLVGPKLPISNANGRYYNLCCGIIYLKNGEITANNYNAKYEVETTKTGAWVMPKFYVGPSEAGFVFKPSAYPLGLDLDAIANPQGLRMIDAASGKSYWFKRQ